jgi:hypothetical protein
MTTDQEINRAERYALAQREIDATLRRLSDAEDEVAYHTELRDALLALLDDEFEELARWRA